MSKFSEYNFKDQKALIRVDFNVPLDDERHITDDTRMQAALPTIKKILDDGGSAILMSHLGRPKDGPDPKFSLEHLVSHLQELLPDVNVHFAKDCIGATAQKEVDDLQSGEVLLLENLRFHREEKKGDEAFAKQLGELGDVYVNDAFGTAHRAHASTAVIAQYFDVEHRMYGMLMNSEIENAEKVLHRTAKPFTAILGGAKVSDKIEIIENLLNKADYILIGGGMAYTFLKAQGYEIGKSLCEEDKLDTALGILDQAKAKGVAFILPPDSVVADQFSNDAEVQTVANDHIPDGWMGLDIGSEAAIQYRDIIMGSKTILWNGPMGVFEMPKFRSGTQAVAVAVAEATEQGAFSLVGGGDSVAAVNDFGLADKVSYVSTGGGALLEYFEGKELPGIKAIRSN